MPQDEHLYAVLQLRRGDSDRVGARRIRILRAIGEHGSISAAGRALGLTFRGSWEAVRALNNLFPQPLVISQAGGAGGGGAILTDLGQTVIAGFEKLEFELNHLMNELERKLVDHSELSGGERIWSLGVKTRKKRSTWRRREHLGGRGQRGGGVAH